MANLKDMSTQKVYMAEYDLEKSGDYLRKPKQVSRNSQFVTMPPDRKPATSHGFRESNITPSPIRNVTGD